MVTSEWRGGPRVFWKQYPITGKLAILKPGALPGTFLITIYNGGYASDHGNEAIEKAKAIADQVGSIEDG